MNTQTMIFLIVWWVGGLTAVVYLVTTGHPWFAAFVLLITASIRVRWGDDEKSDE